MRPSLSPEDQYEKAKRKEKAILLVEEKGIGIEEAFSECGFKMSRYSYPPAYNSQGIETQ